jgi:hypothetical protein
VRTGGRNPFTTVRSEGAILPPYLLERIVGRDKDLDGLRAEDYHLAGETINEAASRAWNVLRGAWAAFKARRENLADDQPETALTRERWLLPLFRELDYGRLGTERAAEIEGKSYPISHRWQKVPIHLVGFRADLDTRTPGVAGAARTSPHGLVQEFLNRSDECLWAFVSNGLRLRILRDNASLTRQAYVEFDLEAMMDGEVYPDFVLLWMLCHQSRVEGDPAGYRLEEWSRFAAERGARALDRLRGGVEQAIRTLGSGFLSHRANEALRRRLYSGELSAQDYYRQLLRLVYRLLFLFVTEDRDRLLLPDADEAAKKRYVYYSTRKLRDHAEKRVGGRHPDLYRQLSLVFRLLGSERGGPELALPALGGFLFDEEATPDLDAAEIENRHLLDAVRALSSVEVAGASTPVNYKDLGAEELGSVYESLLELHPEIGAGGAFELKSTAGNERKTTGSYYTPDSLVTSLLDTALDPVLDEAANKPDPERAILALKVCDPAVGSGHFLIRAAHRIAKRLAAIRTGDEEPAPGPQNEALHEVISTCLYGVDVNPMAAELCRFNLLLEGVVAGEPLSFLDHHVQVGNSLLGTTRDLVNGGIPDDAFKPIEGDDNKLVSAYKRRNHDECAQSEAGQLSFSLRTLDRNQQSIEKGYRKIEEGEESSVAAVREKAARYEALRSSEDFEHQRLLYDAWCAAFVWPKRESEPEAITQATLASLTHGPDALSARDRDRVRNIRERYGLFHWGLAFPDVFGEEGSSGFDVVLGNAPWEHTELKEQEWFAVRRPDIANAPGARRKRMIEDLATEDPALYRAFKDDLRAADGFSHFVRNSGRFPLCGRGRINTYAIFAETKRQLISGTGRVGAIVPSGIATDNTTKEFFRDLVSTKTLFSLYDFENRKGIFESVHRSYKFCLLTMTGGDRPMEAANFAFFALDVADLKDPERRFPLSAEDIRLLNPNTRTCPIFRTRRDAEITKEMYRRVPILIDENTKDGNPWGITFKQGLFNMTSDSGLFCTREELEADGWELEGNIFYRDGECYLPLYEGKMIDLFDHRAAGVRQAEHNRTRQSLRSETTDAEHADPTFVPVPRYWVVEPEVNARWLDLSRSYAIGFRDVTTVVTDRTFTVSLIPKTAVGNSLPLMFPQPSLEKGVVTCLIADLSSFAFDYVARKKIPYLHVNFFILNQLPALPPDAYDSDVPWDDRATLRDWFAPRVLELTYTAWDLEPFAHDLGYDGSPFRWNPKRRFLLRCELDAAFFHLYGIGRDDADYIMETFPIVKRKDEAAHGEYRTKRVILEIYDQMACAAEAGQAYQTPLDPPPVNLSTSRPFTVTPLRPRRERPATERRAEPRLEESPPLQRVAEERSAYTHQPPPSHTPESEEQMDGATESTPADNTRSLAITPQPQAPSEPEDATQDGTATPETPNLYEAALALHVCLADGQQVEHGTLLADAARELGHPKLTKKVRRALNKALNAEHNKERLKTDWQRVWKPRKK